MQRAVRCLLWGNTPRRGLNKHHSTNCTASSCQHPGLSLDRKPPCPLHQSRHPLLLHLPTPTRLSLPHTNRSSPAQTALAKLHMLLHQHLLPPTLPRPDRHLTTPNHHPQPPRHPLHERSSPPALALALNTTPAKDRRCTVEISPKWQCRDLYLLPRRLPAHRPVRRHSIITDMEDMAILPVGL